MTLVCRNKRIRSERLDEPRSMVDMLRLGTKETLGLYIEAGVDGLRDVCEDLGAFAGSTAVRLVDLTDDMSRTFPAEHRAGQRCRGWRRFRASVWEHRCACGGACVRKARSGFREVSRVVPISCSMATDAMSTSSALTRRS